MPIPKKVTNYLDKHNAKYEIVEHRKVFTAYDAAATLHVKVSQLAKNLLIKAGRDYFLAVLPADRNVDFEKLAKLAKVTTVTLPKEKVLQERFKVKPGALSGFGGVYKLPVFVDKNLIKENKIILSSGSYTESIMVSMKEFLRLENPQLGVFSIKKKVKTARVKSKPKKKSISKRAKKR